MTNLKVITFNCRGVANDFKRKKIFSFLHEKQFYVICLQETHSLKEDEGLWRTQWGGQACFCRYTSRSKGVAILFKPSLNVRICNVLSDENGRFIILQIHIDELEYILVNIYGPNEDNPDFLWTFLFFALFLKMLLGKVCGCWVQSIWRRLGACQRKIVLFEISPLPIVICASNWDSR